MDIRIKGKEKEGTDHSVMELYLVYAYGRVQLHATDHRDIEWVIGEFNHDGALELTTGISKDTGWPLDAEGRLIIHKDK